MISCHHAIMTSCPAVSVAVVVADGYSCRDSVDIMTAFPLACCIVSGVCSCQCHVQTVSMYVYISCMSQTGQHEPFKGLMLSYRGHASNLLEAGTNLSTSLFVQRPISQHEPCNW